MKYFILLLIYTLLTSPLPLHAQNKAVDICSQSIQYDTKESGKIPSIKNYMFKSVKIGDITILSDQAGKKIGILRNIGGTIMCYDMKNNVIGMIKGEGNAAVFLDTNGKKVGLVSKNGNSYIIYNQTGTKIESRILAD